MEWKRPKTIPYPSVWTEFEGAKENDGTKPKFWIQDVTEDMVKGLAEKFLLGFIEDEPLCKHMEFIEDTVSVSEAIEIYKRVLGTKLSCVCMTNDSEGVPKIVGISCLGRITKNDPKPQYVGKARVRLRSLMRYVYSIKDVFIHFGIDEYLSDYGMYVLPEYRGQGIALEFLKCWPIICKAIGLKVVIGVFTSKYSQSTADRAGFSELLSISYEKLAQIDPEYDLPGIQEHTKNLRILYMTV